MEEAAPSTYGCEQNGLGHAEVLERIGQGADDLRDVAGQSRATDDVGIDGVGGDLTLLLGGEGLLLEQGGQEFVGILRGAQGKNTCGVDLIEHRNLGV